MREPGVSALGVEEQRVNVIEIGDARFPLQHQLQCMDAGIPERLRWLETVDGYPRTGGITLSRREIKDHGAIGTMIHCDAVAA